MITVEEYKTWSGISGSDQDAEIAEAILLMTALVEHYCGRGLEYKTDDVYTEDYPRSETIVLWRYPVDTITTILVDSVELAEYDLDRKTGRLASKEFLTAKNVEVTYNSGYQLTPDALKAAMFSLVNVYLTNKENIGQGVRSVTVFDFAKVDYAAGTSEALGEGDGLLTPWLYVLDLYRSHRVMGAA